MAESVAAKAAEQKGFDANKAGEYAAAKAAFLEASKLDPTKPQYAFSAANMCLKIGTPAALREAKLRYSQLERKELPPKVPPRLPSTCPMRESLRPSGGLFLFSCARCCCGLLPDTLSLLGHSFNAGSSPCFSLAAHRRNRFAHVSLSFLCWP